MLGYICLHRCLLDKPIWKLSTPEQKTILITLLLMVNHEENEWEWKGEKFKVKPGQTVTSLDNIAKACGKGVSIQNIRTALVRFSKLGFLTNESTKTGRLITIINWDTYQTELVRANKETNSRLTKTQQRPNKDLTPNNNDKNDNNNSCSSIADAIDFFGKNIHLMPTPFEIDEIKQWANQMSPEVILEAMKEAVLNGKKTMSYINGILRNWHAAGITTMEALEAHRRDRENGQPPRNAGTNKKQVEPKPIIDRTKFGYQG